MKKSAAKNPQLSLVIPFYNESENAQPVIEEAALALKAWGQSFEIVAVNDGSKDNTASVLWRLSKKIPQVTVLDFKTNRGQSAALYDGLHSARGLWVATMDGDGQNDPADIPAMAALIKSGKADLVAGWRQNRNDSAGRKIMSRFANWVRRPLLRDGLQDAGCALRVFRREVVSVLLPLRMWGAFIPALALAAGFRVAEVAVGHRPRTRGEAKYNLRVMAWKPFVDTLGVAWFIRRRFLPGLLASKPRKGTSRNHMQKF